MPSLDPPSLGATILVVIALVFGVVALSSTHEHWATVTIKLAVGNATYEEEELQLGLWNGQFESDGSFSYSDAVQEDGNLETGSSWHLDF